MLPLPARPALRDALLGVLLTLVAELELLLGLERVTGSPLGNALSYLLILPAVALRRRAPLLGILCAAVGFALEPLTGPAPVATPYLVLLFLLASFGWYAGTRAGIVGLALVLLGGLTYDLTRAELNVADLVVNVVIIVAAWMGGRVLRVTTDRRVAAELAADRAARDAVTRERERIGRDLHDSMAHALTLITLRAGGARERTEAGVAADALGAIEQSGREALADMHRFLDLLGGAEGGDEAPGVSHLPELVEGVRRGGLDVELDVSAGDLPPSVSTTVYRVVQEALTNVVRHSDADRARVEVSRDRRTLVARVSDDGRPAASAVNGSGRGLAGLRERLALFEGTLDTSSSDQGWSVEARIPLGDVAR